MNHELNTILENNEEERISEKQYNYIKYLAYKIKRWEILKNRNLKSISKDKTSLTMTIQNQIKKVQEKELRFAEDLVKEILNDK